MVLTDKTECLMSDPTEISGGTDEGGAFAGSDYRFLRRSELRLLQKSIGAYPRTTEDRASEVEALRKILAESESERSKIAAMSVGLAMDRHNLEIVKTATDAAKPVAGPVYNTQINLQELSDDQLRARLADLKGQLAAVDSGIGSGDCGEDACPPQSP